MGLTDLEVDSNGNCYLTGIFQDQQTIGTYTFNATHPGYSGPDFFVAKLNPAGNVLWAKHGMGDDEDHPISLSVDNSGNVYLSGVSYSMTLAYDGQSLPAGLGMTQGILMKTDSSGNLQWFNRYDASYNVVDLFTTYKAFVELVYIEVPYRKLHSPKPKP